MELLDCGACGATLIGRAQRGGRGQLWCESCWSAASEQVHENYAQEEELGLVDRHALVLDELERVAEGREA